MFSWFFLFTWLLRPMLKSEIMLFIVCVSVITIMGFISVCLHKGLFLALGGLTESEYSYISIYRERAPLFLLFLWLSYSLQLLFTFILELLEGFWKFYNYSLFLKFSLILSKHSFCKAFWGNSLVQSLVSLIYNWVVSIDIFIKNFKVNF